MSSAEASHVVRGQAWVFGDDISTDLLDPGQYAIAPLQERIRHTLEAVDPRFASQVRPGDVLVAGKNFGCGSSRETAAEALRALGVGCVVAESLARIFLRNAVAIGLPVLVCPGARETVREGDPVEVDLGSARVTNLRTGLAVRGSPLPPLMREILAAGGMLPLLRRLAAEAAEGRGWVDDLGS
jgi:3-isopropylmalate/(R)-2-methylmalate dehydratase small subunit